MKKTIIAFTFILLLLMPIIAQAQQVYVFDVVTERTFFINNDSDQEIANFWLTIWNQGVVVDEIYINGVLATDYVVESATDTDGTIGQRIVFGTPENSINQIPVMGSAIVKISFRNTSSNYNYVGWQPDTKQAVWGFD